MRSKRAERLSQPSCSAVSSSMQLVSICTCAATLREPQTAHVAALPANATSTISHASRTRMFEFSPRRHEERMTVAYCKWAPVTRNGGLNMLSVPWLRHLNDGAGSLLRYLDRF